MSDRFLHSCVTPSAYFNRRLLGSKNKSPINRLTRFLFFYGCNSHQTRCSVNSGATFAFCIAWATATTPGGTCSFAAK